MENYFRDALHNFIFEEAGGGAIRHLANRGYTARQITDALSFPMPYDKVREAFTKYLLECGILLKERPSESRRQIKTEYVREYDKYGKPSFRKVTVSEDSGQSSQPDKHSGTAKWEEMEFSEFLLLYRKENGKEKLPLETELAEAEKNIYISCDFGAGQTEEISAALEQAQREYIQGICWMRRTMYHLLDQRMLGIAVRMQEAGSPAGKVYVRH